MNLSKAIFRLALGQRLPIIKGQLEIDGLCQPVLIRRDQYGIPYIEAQTEQDGWYGLGFCHGQDRAFQLESLLRVVRGTLAEIIGPDALPMDRFSRRVGFHWAAQQQWAVLNEEVRHWAEAYARGINAGITRGCSKRAHEFVLLGIQPTCYTAIDAVAVNKLLAFRLSSNWDIELMRLRVLTQDGPEALTALDAAYPDWLPVTSPPKALAGQTIDYLAQDLMLFGEMIQASGASNNWVVASARSATGRPLLANDPHLSPSLPSSWYLAHLHTPQWTVAGVSFVGTPTFPAAHNGFAAWGITAGMIDNTDLFIEEIGSDGRSIRQGDHFISCELRREKIQVKGQGIIEEDILLTPRGPLISPVLQDMPTAISLSATWLAARPLQGLLYLQRTQSFEEFRRYFAQWPGVSLNMAYADTSNTIGWQLIGEAPQRRKGWGTLPTMGWDEEAGWQDEPVPFEQLPFLVNPEIGFVATANTQPTREATGAFLGVDWLDGYRLVRINEVLDLRRDWDLAGLQALQLDQVTVPWRELRPIVLSMPVKTKAIQQGLAILEAWDGRVSADSAAATLFECFKVEIMRRAVRAKAPRTADWVLGKSPTPMMAHSLLSLSRMRHLSGLLRQQPDGWFENGWPQEIAEALDQVMRELAARYGADATQWAWGRVAPLTLEHPLGKRTPLNRVFNIGPFPWGGDENTIGQRAINLFKPTGNARGIASLRMVIDVGNWDASRYILPGGQSGNPLSPHYADQLPLWQQGEGVAIAWSPAQVEQAAKTSLRLVPKPGIQERV